MNSSPIADLSYRNYDGPLSSTDMRWWVIAKTTILSALKKRSIWVVMTISSWYYVAMIFVLYFSDQLSQRASSVAGGNAPASLASTLIWKDQFLHGFSYGQIWYLMIALIVGAGCVANDNRANALLVYLSKPCTKLDYIIGKWLGVFIVLYTIMAIPALMFFFYGAMSYRQEGFFYDDYWLFLKLPLVLAIGAAVYSSLIVCVSSMFKQGRLAGATVAGLYFITNFFTFIMYIVYVEEHGDSMPAAAHALVGKLSYLSIDGLNIAMSKAILNTSGSTPFGLPGRGAQFVPMPSLIPILAICGIVCGICMLIAWSRIRAVEVVG